MNSSNSKIYYLFSGVFLAILLFSSTLLATQNITTTQDQKSSLENSTFSHIHLNNHQEKTLFYEHIVHFFEKDSPLTIDDVINRRPHQEWIKSKSAKEIPSYGFSTTPVWLIFKVVNDTSNDIEKIFNITNPLLDKIDFYIRPESGTPFEYHEGDTYPFASRQIIHNTFLFPFLLKKGSKAVIYIRIESTGSLTIPIEMRDINSINEKSQLSDLIERGYVGVCFVMICFNLLIFLATKEIGYFYYTLYVLSLSIIILGINGYGYQFFWPTSPWFQASFLKIFLPIMIFSTLLFFYNFLEFHKKATYLQWILKFWIANSLILIILGFAFPWSVVVLPNTILFSIVTPLLLLLATKELIIGDPNAKLYFIAWLPVNIALFATGLTRANVIDIDVPTHELIATIVFEMILISLALAEKINRGKREKGEAQSYAISNLERYEELYNHAIEGMFSYDETSQYFKCNQAFFKLFETVPQHDLRNLSSIFDHFPEDYRAEVITTLSENRAIKNFETPIHYPSSIDPMWVSITIQITSSSDDGKNSYKGIFIDISERIKKEQANLERQEAIENEALSEDKNRTKSEFFASMSHEYRTPLNAIIGFTQILAEEDLSPKQRQMLGHIKTGGQDLLALVNDVLDISKIEAQKFDFETIEVDILAMIDHVDASFAVLAAKKGIDFSIEYQFPLPKTIISDPVRIKQTILNLCSNAIKFTDQGKVMLQVRCEQEHEKMYFSVLDSGIGLKSDQIDILFNAYSQAEKSTSRKFGGTGLGLNLSKQIAQNLGGDIVVDSEFGRGSTFTLSISTGPLKNVVFISSLSDTKSTDTGLSSQKPIDHDNGDAANTDYPAHNNLTPIEKHQDRNNPLSVLLVEDNIVNQRIISHIICQTGLKCVIANNGLEAIAYIMMQQFSLVLMDIHMPQLSGLETVKFLRTKGVELKIIALTGDAAEADVKRSLDAGFDSHLIKPIDVIELRNVLAKHIANESPKTHAGDIASF